MTLDEARELLAGLRIGQRLTVKSGHYEGEVTVARELRDTGSERFQYRVLVAGPHAQIDLVAEHLATGRQTLDTGDGE